jgi:hypothetical protein
MLRLAVLRGTAFELDLRYRPFCVDRHQTSCIGIPRETLRCCLLLDASSPTQWLLLRELASCFKARNELRYRCASLSVVLYDKKCINLNFQRSEGLGWASDFDKCPKLHNIDMPRAMRQIKSLLPESGPAILCYFK